MKRVLLITMITATMNFGFQCHTHADKCETLREHIKKDKTIDPNG
jgi:hypothetical protein